VRSSFVLAAGTELNPILSTWQEIVFAVIGFALVCFVLMRFVRPMLEKAFAARVEEIEGGIRHAEEAQTEADRLRQLHRAKLAGVRVEAARLRDQARADAEAVRQDVLARTREESDRIIAAGRDQLAARRRRIAQELRSEVGNLVVDLAGMIVVEALADEARGRRAVGRFIDGLDRDRRH
jgi:F-type H+-transporting ATPase subunit b